MMKLKKTLLGMILVLVLLLALPLSVNAIGFNAETIYDSVFVIYSGDALGSGFAIGENCVITNAHVIDDVRDVTVQNYNGEEFPATVMDMDEDKDIAVLVVEEALTYLPVADIAKTNIGSDVYAIGAPQSLSYTLTKGVLSAKEREVSDYTYLQTDAAINNGNSGGPLLNDQGEVLGVNTLKLLDSEGIGLAIPITRVCEYMESLGIELEEGGNVKGRLDMPEAPPVTDDPYGDSYEYPGIPGLPFDIIISEDIILLVVVSIFGLGIAGTVLFLILYLKERKKNKKLKAELQKRPYYPNYPNI